MPSHAVKVENGRVLVSEAAVTKRGRLPHEPHPLAREPEREPGPIRVLGISTTSMTKDASALQHVGGPAAARARERARERRRECETR